MDINETLQLEFKKTVHQDRLMWTTEKKNLSNPYKKW